MIVFVANLGSTSFKYKLFAMTAGGTGGTGGGGERVLGQGDADRIGQGGSTWSLHVGDRHEQGHRDLADHAAAIDLHLEKLLALGAIGSIEDIDAIGFKAVHGGPISGAAQVDDRVLATMEEFTDVAPLHNPPYIAAMRAFGKKLPQIPQVAAFESGFHQTIPMARQVYGIPYDWTEKLGIRRYGFHGASHRYIAVRMAQIAPDVRRIISCHLGGSSSISAIRDGRSEANSFGMTAQSGTFHTSRVGDFDTFALLKLLQSGLKLDDIWHKLGSEGGLKGISGVSADMRDVQQAAEAGNQRARLAIDAFVESCRHYVGAYLAVLNGADALVFTGGIGQNDAKVRQAICADMDFAGITLDTQKNQSVTAQQESRIDCGATAVWVVPTDEELIVARQTVEVLAQQPV